MSGFFTPGLPAPTVANGALPLTGNETIPMDTNKLQGVSPESVGISSFQLVGIGPPFANGNWTGNVTLTPGNGPRQTATLTGNIVLGNVTNPIPGILNELVLTQDGTGSRTLTVGSMWTFPGGNTTLTTTAGGIDQITWWYDATANKIRALRDLAFA